MIIFLEVFADCEDLLRLTSSPCVTQRMSKRRGAAAVGCVVGSPVDSHERLVIIGGGIAGVTCAQELCRLLQQRLEAEEEERARAAMTRKAMMTPTVTVIAVTSGRH